MRRITSISMFAREENSVTQEEDSVAYKAIIETEKQRLEQREREKEEVFFQSAMNAGFSHSQAEFMWKYLSRQSHEHREWHA